MKTVFVSDLKALLDLIARQMELYVPIQSGDHYVYKQYASDGEDGAQFNAIRACTPVKEFMVPVRELASGNGDSGKVEEIKPYAVFGLKDCDIRSIELLDKVFGMDEFEDPFYTSRRNSMFIIASDCTEAGPSCICNVFNGKPFVEKGYDLNVSPVSGGFVIESGSDKGAEFIAKSDQSILRAASEAAVNERDKNRTQVQQQLEENNADLKFDTDIRDIVEQSDESEVYDAEAETCIECQACTRICPTCHCFYLYDLKKKDYFAKMKMWDSCMRLAYAAVAGGGNPHKMLGDRIKHRLMHKFVYFLDRYGIQMCLGCGRCIDAEAGGVDLREILKKLSDESKNKGKAEVAK